MYLTAEVIGVFGGWHRGALPLIKLFLPPLKIFNDAVQQADNEVSKAQKLLIVIKWYVMQGWS